VTRTQTQWSGSPHGTPHHKHELLPNHPKTQLTSPAGSTGFAHRREAPAPAPSTPHTTLTHRRSRAIHIYLHSHRLRGIRLTPRRQDRHHCVGVCCLIFSVPCTPSHPSSQLCWAHCVCQLQPPCFQCRCLQRPNFPQGGLPPQPGFPGQRPPFQQPRQTGFPGMGSTLVPQTGFHGSFQQQQRPPVPPVPPLPSQFQQQPPPLPPSSNLLGVNQQNHLLTSSSGFGGSNLIPQQTGFPRPSGRIQPLVPRATGFVDPCLQMMSNTFLPAQSCCTI
jgi:hypothetical protein